ncbi:MAG: lipocalin family protein [Chitinophagaceae bacterium]|nr:lipocalin family protein [Chitinophagaceae bacterium]
MKNISLFLLTLFLIGISSCKKDKQKSKTELLVQASWKLSNVKANGNDVTSSIPACLRDNILTFEANGSGNVNEGPTKCNASDPNTYSITWSFRNGETQIQINPAIIPGGSDIFSLDKLTETELVLSQNVQTGASTTNMTFTFIH